VQTNIKKEFHDSANTYGIMLGNIWQNNIRKDHITLQSGSAKIFPIPLLSTKCKCRPDCEIS